MKLKEIRVFISENVHNHLKVKAAQEKQTMQDLAAASVITAKALPADYLVPVLGAIEQWVDKHNASFEAANISEKVS